MDNICHTLTGVAFGEAGLKARTRFGTVTLMVAANLPDIDVLVFATDTPSVAFRRGWTHGPLAQLLLPVVLTGLVLVVGRLFPAGGHERAPVRPWWVLLLAYAGVLSHVGLDLLNSYGLRLLAPFDWRWFYGDTLFILDPWLWTILGASIWLARRRGTPRPARRGLAIAAAYIVLMVVAARTARTIVSDTWQTAHGSAPLALMVGPVPITPFTRQVVIDAGQHYETGGFDWLPPRLTLNGTRVPKRSADPRVAQARGEPRIEGFLVWSRFPFWTFEPTAGGTRVTVSDMRFAGGTPVRFAASVVIPATSDRMNRR